MIFLSQLWQNSLNRNVENPFLLVNTVQDVAFGKGLYLCTPVYLCACYIALQQTLICRDWVGLKGDSAQPVAFLCPLWKLHVKKKQVRLRENRRIFFYVRQIALLSVILVDHTTALNRVLQATCICIQYRTCRPVCNYRMMTVPDGPHRFTVWYFEDILANKQEIPPSLHLRNQNVFLEMLIYVFNTYQQYSFNNGTFSYTRQRQWTCFQACIY